MGGGWVTAKALASRRRREGGAVGARLLDEQRAARVALARILAAFEVSDGADIRASDISRASSQLEVDRAQHVGGRATF